LLLLLLPPTAGIDADADADDNDDEIIKRHLDNRW
jgi:hypothetical protein